MIDNILYGIWLWLSARWYPYRLTGVNPESGEMEIITFASENINIDAMIESLRKSGTGVNEIT